MLDLYIQCCKHTGKPAMRPRHPHNWLRKAHDPRRLKFRATYLVAPFLSSHSPVRDRCVVSNYSLIGIGRCINIIGAFVLINRGNLPHATQHEKRDHQQEQKTHNHWLYLGAAARSVLDVQGVSSSSLK